MATMESFHLREPLLTPIILSSSFITPKFKNFMRLTFLIMAHQFNNYHHQDKRTHEIELNFILKT